MNRLRPEDAGIGEQRHRILRVLQHTFAGDEAKSLVFDDGKPKGSAVLVAAETILGRLAGDIGLRGIEGLPGRQRRSEGKRIAGVQSVVAEEAKSGSMQRIGAALGDDIHRGAVGAAQFRAIVAAVDLELLHCVLAHGEAHAAGFIIGFAAIYGNAVAAAVAAVERKSTLRRLLHAEILVRGELRGVGNTGSKQRKAEIVTAVDRQVFNVLRGDHVRLMAAFGIDHRRFGSDLNAFRCLRNLHVEIKRDGLPHVDDHVLLDLGGEAGNGRADVVIAGRQS